MKRIVLTYGLIAGVIVGGMLMITMPLYEKGILKLDNGQLLGYTTMVIALSLVFVGIKSYRDRQLNGLISFGSALKVGLLIAAIASLMYAICWEITYNTMSGDFIQLMNDHYQAKMKTEGASEAKLQESMNEMKKFAEMYKNPVFRFGMTLMEIFPVGIIISLLSAALLRKKHALPTTIN